MKNFWEIPETVSEGVPGDIQEGAFDEFPEEVPGGIPHGIGHLPASGSGSDIIIWESGGLTLMIGGGVSSFGKNMINCRYLHLKAREAGVAEKPFKYLLAIHNFHTYHYPKLHAPSSRLQRHHLS